MLESWNNGIKENRNQNAYFFMEFLFFDVVLCVAKVEKNCLMSIITKSRPNIFFRKSHFPVSIPSIPIFHSSIIPSGLIKSIVNNQ